jgi:heparin/heparan-sulfate lyase
MQSGRRQFLLACGGAALLPAAPLQKKMVDGVEIPLPGAARPRLYLRPSDIAGLRLRFTHPSLADVVKQMEGQAARSTQHRIEWDALHYLTNPDTARGRRIVEECLALVRATQLPDRQDACRVTGRMMTTGAIVYDWLYPLLTAAEKQAFIAELVRLAKTQECGYPPGRMGSVTGHASEAMLMRDILSAGVAVHDEYPEMYEIAARRVLGEHVPARNWFYPGHAYHQGDSYGPYRYSWDVFPLFIFDRLGAGAIYNPEQRGVPYYFLYATRPDGQRLRNGDTFSHSAPRGAPWAEGLGTVLTASYYGDPVLLGQHLRQQSSGGENAIFEFLWRDPELRPAPLDSLPLSRYFGSPFGWMIARTGWDAEAVVAEMKVNEYNFVNHQHLDAGAFQIWRKGALAIDSGLYSGQQGAYGSEHGRNYYWRSIAHNTLLIHDPTEQFPSGYGNDGGQRLPNRRSEARNLATLQDAANGYRTGEVLAHGFGPDARKPDYTLLQGDLTRAYSAKVKLVRRSSVFFHIGEAESPAALIVFDRVVAADPSFRKAWLLHALGEPRTSGASATLDAGDGRLFLDALLPARASLEKVGGPGREYLVGEKNFPNDLTPRLAERGSAETGAWRLELRPRDAAAEDHFLAVMQVASTAKTAPSKVTPLDASGRVGCAIAATGACWCALFRKDAARSAEPVRFTAPAGRACRILVADLTAGTWIAEHAGTAGSQKIAVSAESGAAWLNGPGGEWVLKRAIGE